MAGGGFGSRYTPTDEKTGAPAPGGFGSRYGTDPFNVAGGGGGGSDPFNVSGGGGFGSRYGGSELQPPKKKGRHGVAGFFENLGSDVGPAVKGIVPSIVNTAKAAAEDTKYYATGGAYTHKNPADGSHVLNEVAKPLVDQAEYQYGPLAHGHVNEFLHRVYDHPLGPILDLLTVLSGGLGGTAKVARALDAAGVDAKSVQALSKLDRPGTITLRNPHAGDEGAKLPAIEKLTRPTSSRPLRKATQKAIDAGQRAIPGKPGEIVAVARFGRELKRSPDIRAQQLRLGLIDYTKAFAPLSSKERVALQTLGRLPLPKHLDEWKRQLGDVVVDGGPEAGSAEATLKLLEDPDVARLYANPSDKMLAAHAAADTVGRQAADLLGIDPEQAQLSRLRHVRLVSGAVAYTARDARRRITQLDRELRRTNRTTSEISTRAARLRTRGTPELTEAARARTKTYNELSRAGDARSRLNAGLSNLDELEQAVARSRGDVERLASGRELSSDELLAGGIKPGSDLSAARTRLLGRSYDHYTRLAARYDRALAHVSQLAQNLPEIPAGGRQTAESAALTRARGDVASRLHAGRAELERLTALEDDLAGERGLVRPGIVGGPDPHHLLEEIKASGRPEPLYLPDTAHVERRGIFGRGRTATHAPSAPVHRSSGMLFRVGQLALEPDVLSPEYLRSVVYAHYVDLHEALLEAATPIFRGESLPKGWEYVRRLPGERIGYVEKTAAEHRQSLAQLVPDAAKPYEGGLAQRGLTGDESEALIDHGRRYAVPARLARRFESEFHASDKAAAQFLKNFTTVWRSLVLGLRVGFLTNNIVGNHLLYALRYAGPAGARAYLNAIRRERGESAVAAMLKRYPIPSPQRRAFMEEHFPEQVSGTLIDTQLPKTRGGRAMRIAGLGLVPADRAVEQTLRRAGVEASLRKTPEFKQAARELSSSSFVAAMPSQTSDFEAAARKALADHPDLQRRVTSDVNDALGDFLSLSEFEKRTVRAAIPFYAWYRAITQIALKLPLDTPGRTAILARLGEVGSESTNDELGPLPSYLQGAIPIGGDRAIETQGLNPLATLTQVGDAARAVGPDASAEDVQALVDMLNPVFSGLAKEYARTQDASYGRHGGSPYSVPGDVLSQIITQLPQFRLGRAATGHAPPSVIFNNSALEREGSSFLGVPIREINRAVAAMQARQGR